MKKYLVKLSAVLLAMMALTFCTAFMVSAAPSNENELSMSDYSLAESTEEVEISSAVSQSNQNSVENSAAEQTAKKSKNKSRDWAKIILISVGVSAVITLIWVLSIYHSYKTNGRTEPYPYNQKAPLELKLSEDILIDTNVERKKIT